MFKRISNIIAMRFTAFVFLLMLINGVLFLIADLGNSHRMGKERLERAAFMMMEHANSNDIRVQSPMLPPRFRERTRMLNAKGEVLYGSQFFADIPPSVAEGMTEITVDDERYRILTKQIAKDGVVRGYVQIAGIEHLRAEELPLRALLFLLVSVAISALIFVVGLRFARTSLEPAEAMMQRLEQFTQDASHELRTPLAALLSSLDLALKKENYKEGILSAKEDVKQLTAIVEKLMELARLDQFAATFGDVDVSALTEEVAEKFRLLAEQKGMDVDINVKQGVHVQGDATLLRQMMTNLLSNALKFSKAKGGKIRVELGTASLAVHDNGIGIAPEALPHIFDRFYQQNASRSEGGFGLGLALVQRIAELHNWCVTAKSKEGEETVFTVHFAKEHKK